MKRRELDPEIDDAAGDPANALSLEGGFLLEEIQALAHVGSWVLDMGSGQLVWSRECRRIFGIAQGVPVTRKTYHERVHPQDQARVLAGIRRALDDGAGGYEVDHRILRPDGALRWVVARARILRDERGQPIRVMGVVQDVTERKQVIEELRASEQQLRRIAAIVEWSNDAIVGCNLDGTIASWNRSAARLFGYQAEEVFARSIAILLPDDLLREGEELSARVRRGDAVERHVTVRRRKDGSHVEVSLTMSPIRDGAGEIVGFSKIARDLTEQRSAEHALKQAEQQLRDAQKLEAVGLLAGGIAHDFNNMLSVIAGYTELVLENLSPADPLRSDLLEVRKAGASAIGLTRQLLAFSRRQMLQPRVIDLNQIVANLERMARRLIGAHIALSFATAEDLGRVSADPAQIEQVIINLVLNARDAMDEGGRLTISTSNVELADERAEALNLRPGPYVMLSVSDTGSGIDPATRARIFEPFFTTKEKGKGTGLGLSTALGIVQQSGGVIDLESEPGAGTTFRVYLPRTERPVQSAYSSPPARNTYRSWETVLLVEDEEQVRTLACLALRRQGYHVLEAEQGEQALSICQQHVGSIHLLVSDVIMPRMGGRELAAQAGMLRPDMKVLFMSGYANDEVLPQELLEENFELLQKPITPSSLTRRVREVLDSE